MEVRHWVQKVERYRDSLFYVTRYKLVLCIGHAETMWKKHTVLETEFVDVHNYKLGTWNSHVSRKVHSLVIGACG